MAVALTVVDDWSDGKRQHVIGTLAFSGSYSTGGDALSLLNAKIKSANVRYAEIKGLDPQFRYVYDQANAKVIVYDENQTTGVQAELGAGAYPAGVTGDTVDIYAIFDQLR